jgi:hypothetical protein
MRAWSAYSIDPDPTACARPRAWRDILGAMT